MNAVPASAPAPRKGVSLAKRGDAPLKGKGANLARPISIYNQDGAKKLIILKYLQITLAVMLLGTIALTINFTATKYRIFATTAEGKLFAPPPIDQPVGDNVVNLWLTDAAYKILTIGYHDQALRTAQMRKYFTDRGWESFTRYQRTSNDGFPSIRSQLDNDFLTMWLVNNEPPEILQKLLVGGVFTYRIRINLIVTRDVRGQSTNRKELIEIWLERAPPEVNPQGLAISKWNYMGSR